MISHTESSSIPLCLQLKIQDFSNTKDYLDWSKENQWKEKAWKKSVAKLKNLSLKSKVRVDGVAK